MGREMLGCRMSVPESRGYTQQQGLRDPPSQQSHSHHMSIGAGVPGPWAVSLLEGSPSTSGPCGQPGLAQPSPTHRREGSPTTARRHAQLPGAEGTAPPVPGGLSEQAGVLVLLEVTGLAYTRTAGPEPVVRGTVELQS